MLGVRGLARLSVRLGWKYLLRVPALFVHADRRRAGHDDPHDDSFLVGETPFDTAEAICRRVGLRPEDVFLDAGCGRGKMVFFARLWSGCQAIGVDALETYVRVGEALGVEGVRFVQGDFAEMDLRGVTVLYVHGPNFSERTWEALSRRFADLAPGARVVTVGHACPELTPEHEERLTFSWGRSTVRYYRAIR